MKKALIYLGIIFVFPAAIVLFVGRVFYPDNVAETAPDGGRKDLKTRFYDADPETAVKTVKEIIPTLSTYGGGWKITGETETKEKGITVKAEVPVAFFTDDLEVYIKPFGDGVQIDARSRSRVGKSDFGENARHIRKLFEKLDEKFGVL